MKNINYILLSVFFALGCVLTSCSDDETGLSRKVLASTDFLEFEGMSANPKLITVTSDGDWVAEVPEWVTVSPAQGGAGQTEVTVTVSDNEREGALDNPRKEEVLFKGRNLESIATVTISQNGDKFRDPVDYTISSVDDVKDETVVRLPSMTVVAVTGQGIVVTDGTEYMYIANPAVKVEVGAKIAVIGEKFTNEMKLAYVNGDKITEEGTGTVPDMTPVDITGSFDKISVDKYQYVKFEGIYDGSAVKVGENVCKGYLTDPAAGVDPAPYAGHKVAVTGFFAGQATPVVNIIPVKIEDLGVNETIYFLEDFEWLEPWSAAHGAADIVGTDQKDTTQPQISAKDKALDGVTAEAALLAKGYEFFRDCASSKKPGECIYYQRNYLKFGKTGYQGGIILPAVAEFGDGIKGIQLSFDWYPQRQGDGVMDPTEIVVIVTTGDDVQSIPVPAHGLPSGAKAKWVHVELDLGSVTLTKDTRITIRNIDSQIKSGKALRWHLDNVKMSKPL